MDEIKIILSSNPISTQTVYKTTCQGNYPRLYMSHRGKDKKMCYVAEIRNQYDEKPIKGDIRIELSLFFGTRHKRDIDNYCKLILDSLEGLVFEDDVQIQEMLIKKCYNKEKPRAEIIIEEYEESGSN